MLSKSNLLGRFGVSPKVGVWILLPSLSVGAAFLLACLAAAQSAEVEPPMDPNDPASVDQRIASMVAELESRRSSLAQLNVEADVLERASTQRQERIRGRVRSLFRLIRSQSDISWTALTRGHALQQRSLRALSADTARERQVAQRLLAIREERETTRQGIDTLTGRLRELDRFRYWLDPASYVPFEEEVAEAEQTSSFAPPAQIGSLTFVPCAEDPQVDCLELVGRPEEAVTSPASARVLVSSNHQTLGRVLVLEVGGETVSVTGLGSLSVPVGARLDVGTVLGLAGDTSVRFAIRNGASLVSARSRWSNL